VDTPKIQSEETIDVDEFLAKIRPGIRLSSPDRIRQSSDIGYCHLLLVVSTLYCYFLVCWMLRFSALFICLFGMALVFLLYPSRGSWSRTKLHPLDVVLAIVAACVPLYVVVNYQELVLRAGTVTRQTWLSVPSGCCLCWKQRGRVVGLPIVLVASVFVVYAFIGPYLVGLPIKQLQILAHKGVGLRQLVYHLYF